MKFNPQLKKELENYKEYIILVEGKKDVSSLKSLGFQNVFAVHVTGVPLRERIEEICSHCGKKDKICILTDLDKKGKKLYMYIKPIVQEMGIKLDSSLRGLLIKARVSHLEGLSKFIEKAESVY